MTRRPGPPPFADHGVPLVVLFFVSLNEYRVANPNDLTQQGAEGTAHQYGPTRSQQSKDGLGEMLGELERDRAQQKPLPRSTADTSAFSSWRTPYISRS